MADMTFKAKLLPAVSDSTEYTLGGIPTLDATPVYWQIAYKNNNTTLPSSSNTTHYIPFFTQNGSTVTAVSSKLNGSALARFAFFSSGHNSLELGQQGVSTGFIALRHKDNQANIYTHLKPSVVSEMRYIDLPDKSGTVVVSSTTGNASQFLRGDNEWTDTLINGDGSALLGLRSTHSGHTASNLWVYASSTMGLMWTNTNDYVNSTTRKKIIALSSDRTYITSDFRFRNSQVIGGSFINGSHSGSFYVDTATTASTGQFFQSWYGGKTPAGGWGIGVLSGNNDLLFAYGTDSNYNSNTNTTSNIRFGYDGKVYGAVWNDYAEFRKENPEEKEQQTPGCCVRELGNGALALTTKRLERGCEIVSDTYGFAIGENKDNGYTVPIASTGRVLAYPYEGIEEFAAHIGWPVCSGPDGTVSIMTEEEEEKYPSRIIGTISEIPDYEEWGSGNVKVNGRVWIRIR